MTYADFKKKYLGKFVEYHSFDPAAKNQCADLANQWIVEGLGLPAIIGTNAIDFPKKADNKYEWIKNTPDGLPKQGDLMIFNIGAYGHISIFDSGDLNSFTSLDQNYPVGSPVKLVKHNYSKVIGWLHPKESMSDCLLKNTKEDQDTFNRLVTNSTHWDEVLKLGYTSAASIKQEHDDLKSQIKSLKEEVSSEKQRADAHKQEFVALQAKAAKALGTVQELNEVYNALDRVSANLDRLEDLERQYAALQLASNEEKENLKAEVAKWKAIAENTAKLGDFDTALLIKEILRRFTNALNLGK